MLLFSAELVAQELTFDEGDYYYEEQDFFSCDICDEEEYYSTNGSNCFDDYRLGDGRQTP